MRLSGVDLGSSRKLEVASSAQDSRMRRLPARGENRVTLHRLGGRQIVVWIVIANCRLRRRKGIVGHRGKVFVSMIIILLTNMTNFLVISLVQVKFNH